MSFAWLIILASATIGAPIAAIGLAVLLGVDWGPVAVATVGGAGIALTAAGAWLGVRRQRSGSIETSEAADLWDFSRDLMRDLREDLVKARERIAVLEQERRDDRKRITDLETEVARLRGFAGD
jgi:hypothetical protein